MLLSSHHPLQWDLFCRVVDNHGDMGVCWRLAVNLAARGVNVRLWVDDASALRWMAPEGARGVQVQPWPVAQIAAEPGAVVIEAFGCELPDWWVARMRGAKLPPVWINLEYLSAEGFVARSHKLPSPQLSGPGTGLCKWFFYPGFILGTGGLIRENDLAARIQQFDRHAWLASQGLTLQNSEQIVSLFCYEQPALPALLAYLANQKRPTLLLATAGYAATQVREQLGPGLHRGALRAAVLPFLSQLDYDHLLWASDMNFVRGEDSFVRAQWAGRPFVWQIYPQHDAAHIQKLNAFLAAWLASSAHAPWAVQVASLWRGWNQAQPASVFTPIFEAPADWRTHCLDWRHHLEVQTDLVNQLLSFVALQQN
jgi:uncharacterized repeat protein (TIGR03837 family)